MGIKTEAIEAIRDLLSALNQGYAKRDLVVLDDSMSIFAQDERLEFITTGGVSPKRGTWQFIQIHHSLSIRTLPK